jgi:hypothetical protein
MGRGVRAEPTEDPDDGGESSAEPVEDDGAADVRRAPRTASLGALTAETGCEGLPSATGWSLFVTDWTVTDVEQRNPAPPCA